MAGVARMTPAQEKELIDRLLAGENHHAIARAMGFSYDRVYRAKRRLPETRHLPRRHAGRPREIDEATEARVCGMIRDGKTAADITGPVGITRNMVDRVAVRNGLEETLRANLAVVEEARRVRDEEICVKILRGWNRKTIAGQYGITLSRVNDIWLASDYRDQVDAARDLVVTTLIRAMTPQRVIGKALRMDAKAVRRRWNKHCNEPWWFKLTPGRRPRNA